MKLYELSAGAKLNLVEDTSKALYKYFSIDNDKYYVLNSEEQLVQLDPWREVTQL